MNRFMNLVAEQAADLDLGLREKDLIALQLQGITFRAMSGRGSFGVTQNGSLDLCLPPALEGTGSDLQAYMDESGFGTRDELLVSVIEGITHELVHAAQFSLYGAAPANMEEFARRLTLMLSGASYFSLTRCFENHQLPLLTSHEMPAYEAGHRLRAAICELPGVEPSVKRAAAWFTSHPAYVSIAAQLDGSEPRKFVDVPR